MKTMKHILNEGFDRLFETKKVIKESSPDAPLTEKQRQIARELLRTVNALAKQGAGIKEAEVAMQDVIERYFPDHEWWEVCDCDIFTELRKDAHYAPINIVKSIRKEFIVEEKECGFEDCDDGECNESVGDRVAEYQKWVDYDMKKYGKISGKTMGILKKDGFTVVKDEYGDLEVIPEEKNHDDKKKSEITEGKRSNKRTFRYDVGDNKYSFYCETEDTRYGFRHLCSMFLRGVEVGDSIKKYYNRTWEMFDYQSAMLSAVENSSVSEEDKKSLKAQINEGEGLREGCKGKKCGSKKLNETGEWEDDEEGIAWKQELSDRVKGITGRRIKVSDIDGFDKYRGPYCYLGDYKFWLDDAEYADSLVVEYDGEFYRLYTRDDWKSFRLGKLEPIKESKQCKDVDDDDISDEEYYAELEKHIAEIPSYDDEKLKAEYKEFKDSTHEDDIRVETALKDEMIKRGFIRLFKSAKESVDESEQLNEGASNFWTMSKLPLLIFDDDETVYDNLYDIARLELGADASDEEVGDKVEELYDGIDYCTLVDDEIEGLKQDVEDFNRENSDTEIKVEIKPGYYEAYQLYCNDKELSDEEVEKVAKFFDDMKKKYYLTTLSVAWRASNGETGYSIVKD